MMVIGVSEERFWNSTVRQLKPYGDAYEKKLFELDRQSHILGAYFYEAVATALANAFSKKGSKTKKYRDKPFSADRQEERRLEHMTEAERLDRVEQIFQMLAGGEK